MHHSYKFDITDLLVLEPRAFSTANIGIYRKYMAIGQLPVNGSLHVFEFTVSS